MKTKSIYHNLYALTHQKTHHPFFTFLIIFSFLLFLFFLIFGKMETFLSLEGIYDCNKESCFIKTILPYDESKNLKNDQKMKIGKEEFPFKVKEFGNVFSEKNIVFQNITIEVPKQEFYLKETIDIKLIQNQKSWLSIFIDSLKGGDEA